MDVGDDEGVGLAEHRAKAEVNGYLIVFTMLFDSMDFSSTEGGYYYYTKEDLSNDQIWSLVETMSTDFQQQYGARRGARSANTIISRVTRIDGKKTLQMLYNGACAHDGDLKHANVISTDPFDEVMEGFWSSGIRKFKESEPSSCSSSDDDEGSS